MIIENSTTQTQYTEDKVAFLVTNPQLAIGVKLLVSHPHVCHDLLPEHFTEHQIV